MRNLLLTTCLGAVAAFAAGAAQANEELIKMSQNPKDWVMPTGNYANQRYSQLKQITADNVGKLQVAWTFSTGVLRGHEGGPLVIGDVMYVHGPFPNPVYALDLKNEVKILWKYEPKQDPNVIPVMCCDTVNRGLAYADGKIFLHQADTTLVALDAKNGKVVWQMKNGDPSKGETGTSAPMVIKDKVLVGISGGEFGVQCHDRLRPQDRQAGLARLLGRSGQSIAGRSRRRPRNWASRSARIRASRPGKATSGSSAAAPPGAGTPTIPELNLLLLRLGQPRHLESRPAAGRQQVVDDDLRARSRHRACARGCTR